MKTTEQRLPVIDRTLKMLCNSYNVYGLDTPISKKMNNQTAFLNHANPLSWLIAPPIISRTCYDEGLPEFKMGVVYHPWVKKIPGLGYMAENIAGTTPKNHREIVKNLKSNDNVSYGTMPEASNCLLKWKDPVGPFRYNGLLLASLEAGSDMYIGVHKGTEIWDKDFPLIKRASLSAYPQLPLPSKKVDFEMAIIPYTPEISLEDVKNYRKHYKKLIHDDLSPIDIEGARMRRFMIEAYKNL